MRFFLRGHLYGLICREQRTPVKETIVRLYRYNNQDSVVGMATAQPKELFKIYSKEELSAKSKDLIAETRTDGNGAYSFDLDEKKQKYGGGPVEIVLNYPDVPDYGQENQDKPKGFKEFDVRVNVFQPKWRETNEGFVIATFNYTFNSKNWCYMMGLLDLWFIFGRLTFCNTQSPIPGIEVTAMDDDWISDDKLGSALTDSSGRFLIVYTSKEFKKTFLSPWINVETPILPWNNGPDVYFKYSLGGGSLDEPPSRGRDKDRENVGNCFCVSLCLNEGPIPGPEDPTNPTFLRIGQNRAYHILHNIDSTTGRTTGKPTAGWNGLAFYDKLSLLGSLNKKMNGKPLEYKFQYEEWDAPGVPKMGATWTDIEKADIAHTVIGYTQVLIPTPDGYEIIETPYAIDHQSGEMEVSFASDNWIKVPQESNFLPNRNGLLINLISTKLMNDSVDMAGLVPGDNVTSIQPLQKNRYYRLRMRIREEGNEPSEITVGVSKVLALFNFRYQNVPKNGSWIPTSVSSEIGVASMDIKEMVGAGCGKITNSLTVQYTAANPNLGNVWVRMTGPGGPYAFPAIAHNTPGEEAHGEVAYGSSVSALPNCAYIVWLHADMKLTNGEITHHDIWDQMAFCKV
ncbi:hypothetical protein SAMN06265379_10142 [Saccharicrinis carchari]|uniref:Uncharacterized protein n=1 Tax=Saccharicrinis carchari TaxID=1168039 RepID=A0A521ACZ7_SACCC|nr:hypothetical protein [Saccharicrinis carchari]SMO32692.1 hypothetical protein SAMN06265379_10142 [Saccharicrinis carchari]